MAEAESGSGDEGMSLSPSGSSGSNSSTGYFKLVGDKWTYVHLLESGLQLGRKLQSMAQSVAVKAHNEANLPAYLNADTLLPVATAKNVSRTHAIIFWKVGDEGGNWHLRVLGKNGLRLNHVAILATETEHQLQNGDRFVVGETTFYFLLPKSSK